MGFTPLGIPFPEPVDRVREGATAMRNLTTKTDQLIADLMSRLTQEVTTLNAEIDREVSVLNTRITDSMVRHVGTAQASSPSYNQIDRWVAFTSGAWPALSVNVPASGRILIGVGALLVNNYDADGGHYCAVGVPTTPSGTDYGAIRARSGRGTAAGIQTTFVSYRTGLTPGIRVFTPGWYISGGAPADITISNGSLWAFGLP